MNHPRILNIGSGKHFIDEALNVDHGAMWRPDVVADLNEPFPRQPGQALITARFGPIVLLPGTFDEILAFDVLEHLRELTTAMTSCLHLLRSGGRMRIQVPYELSLGAWSDPTHVRAFNERSWTYFTAWPWYLGWTDARFDLTQCEFTYSSLGADLARKGVALEALLTTPRAVDAMKVVLTKVPITADQRRQMVEAGLCDPHLLLASA